MYKKQKHQFLHIGALEMGRVTLPQIFTDLYIFFAKNLCANKSERSVN